MFTKLQRTLDWRHWFLGTFPHGIHPAENKHFTAGLPIQRLPFSKRLVLPLSQHAGKPSKPIVHPGQEVVRGEPIALADGFMSVPLHAPATGVIREIELMPTAKGPRTLSIILEVYPGDSQEVRYFKSRNVDEMSQQEIVKAVQETGLVGLGGAAFPTHVKLTPPKDHKVHTVLINGCECEPFLTTDHRVMLEQAEDLVAGTRIFMKALNAERAIIGTENNKLDAVEAIRAKLPKDGSITVQAVKTKYPQGAEKMLAKALMNLEIPSGGYPSSVGLAVFNVSSTAQVGALLPVNGGVIERVVTVTGPGIEKQGNYNVPIGTPIRFILDQLGFRGSAQHIILGGPMMGSCISSLDVPITKGCGGVLVLTERDVQSEASRTSHPCISCGACVEACPMHLNPCQLGRLAYKSQYDEMQSSFHLNDCFECGSCSYVCPSSIPLVQYFRIAKSANREKAKKS
ncbi:electron transport complex, RnfABCDGE type, C subunit subfamily [Verrucomicrobiia bacterium DG1235]|nr:electron transport complex, RnfABCDGE type, C subunit subfamily [Verrucomicrobiae bacterium DG1235]